MRSKSSPILLLILLGGCESDRFAKERDLYTRMDALADRYHAAGSVAQKQTAQTDVLSTLERAEREQALKNGASYYAHARVFAHLRLSKIAFDAGDESAAQFHRAKAEEINRKFSIGAFGGLDLTSPAALPEIARQVTRLDAESVK